MQDVQDEAICVVGLGYIGLPTAIAFALRGRRTIGVDISQETLSKISQGILPFDEPGLDVALANAIGSNRLTVQRELPQVNTYIISVPTPVTSKFEADLSHVNSVIDAIIPILIGGELIVLESTSPPGTTQKLYERVVAVRPEMGELNEEGAPSVEFVYAPERVLPGRIMAELAANDRIIGGLTETAGSRAIKLYKEFCSGEIHLTTSLIAEMVKLTENGFRDLNIAFANELSMMADAIGLDVWKLIDLANKHPRVDILNPGPGVGGHCIAVDPWFLVAAAPENSQLIRKARETNLAKTKWVIDSISSSIGNFAVGETIGILGLAFKPNVGDMRNSPAVEVVNALAQKFPMIKIDIYEPNCSDLPNELKRFDSVTLVGLEKFDRRMRFAAILVGHDSFKYLGSPLLEDGRVADFCGITSEN